MIFSFNSPIFVQTFNSSRSGLLDDELFTVLSWQVFSQPRRDYNQGECGTRQSSWYWQQCRPPTKAWYCHHSNLSAILVSSQKNLFCLCLIFCISNNLKASFYCRCSPRNELAYSPTCMSFEIFYGFDLNILSVDVSYSWKTHIMMVVSDYWKWDTQSTNQGQSISYVW